MALWAVATASSMPMVRMVPSFPRQVGAVVEREVAEWLVAQGQTAACWGH